ncbi:hypothetical protein GQ53DRAFT_732697 [Thozetella sp. PMI_491]|nr:hypothetical protein GQ53DRAFT_732697 [Thozetella sp. PMI_491]
MVGVPGRSKGCQTCRRRRKGCDLGRPRCGQCRRACLDCCYESERVFVNSTPNKAAKSYRLKDEAAPDITLPHALAGSAYEAKWLGLFWDSYLPRGRQLPTSEAWCSIGVWLNAVQQLYLQDATLRQALLATSLVSIGRRDGIQWMREEGLKMYGSALVSMRKLLQTPSAARGEGALLAIRMLNIIHGGDPQNRLAQARAYMGHMGGEISLVLDRGPEAHVSGLAHRIFADARHSLVSSNAQRRKKSPLSTPEWKTIPWTLTPKNSRDMLVDILVDIPGLLEQVDDMRACGNLEEKRERQLLLQRNCWELDAALRAWSATMKPGRSAESFDLNLDCDVPTNDLATAHLMNLYWTVCLLVYGTLHQVSDQKADLPPRTNPALYSHSIALSTAIFFNDNSGWWGQISSAFSTGVAMQYLAASGVKNDDYKRLHRFFMYRKGGVRLADFLQSLQRLHKDPSKQLVDVDGFEASRVRAMSWLGRGDSEESSVMGKSA